MKYRSIVHIGFHKTGTTSLQAMLATYRDRLLRKGLAFYNGIHIDSNHVELHVAAMRLERMSPFKMMTGLTGTNDYRDHVFSAVDKFAEKHSDKCLVFSAEGISYLRYEDEISWLTETVPKPMKLIACLRNKSDYLASYRAEMEKHTLPETIAQDTFAYTEDDSWLLNYEDRIRPFCDAVGADHLALIDYDSEVRKSGSIIPSFLSLLDLEGEFSAEETGWFLNKSMPGG